MGWVVILVGLALAVACIFVVLRIAATALCRIVGDCHLASIVFGDTTRVIMVVYDFATRSPVICERVENSVRASLHTAALLEFATLDPIANVGSTAAMRNPKSIHDLPIGTRWGLVRELVEVPILTIKAVSSTRRPKPARYIIKANLLTLVLELPLTAFAIDPPSFCECFTGATLHFMPVQILQSEVLGIGASCRVVHILGSVTAIALGVHVEVLVSLFAILKAETVQDLVVSISTLNGMPIEVLQFPISGFIADAVAIVCVEPWIGRVDILRELTTDSYHFLIMRPIITPIRGQLETLHGHVLTAVDIVTVEVLNVVTIAKGTGGLHFIECFHY